MTSARVLCLFALLVAITADANCHNHAAPPVIPKVAVAEPEVNQASESTATENLASAPPQSCAADAVQFILPVRLYYISSLINSLINWRLG